MTRLQIHPDHRGFSLMELIVVIVVIAIVAAVTTVAYRSMARSYRLSASVNTVTAALENARALAIRNNRYTLTTFRPRLSADGRSQVIEVVVAEWRGDSANASNGGSYWTYDRFEPVRGLSVRQLGVGANVAGPGWSLANDDLWMVSSYLPKIDIDRNAEPLGDLVGVLYSPEGRVVFRNSESGADRLWVDFNMDGRQTIDSDPNRDGNTDDAFVLDWVEGVTQTIPSGAYFGLEGVDGEPFIAVVPFLAVFDERSVRAEYDTAPPWGTSTDADDRYQAYTDDVIATDADRIQFNRYSGVVMR